MRVFTHALAPFFLYLVTIAVLNYRALNPLDDKRPAAAVLGVTTLLEAKRANVLKLSLPQVALLFRALAYENATAEPRGVFRGEQIDLGLTWLAGAGVITRYGMGICNGACTPGQSHLGPWVGKWFDEHNSTVGGNLFQQQGRTMSRARPFRVVRSHPSEMDGRGVTQLDYRWVDLPLLGFMRDEVRCVHADLCLGFGGFTIAGGIRISGSPFLLHRTRREEANSEMDVVQQDEL